MGNNPESTPVREQLNQLSRATRDRLAHIEFTLMFKGSAVRSDLIDRFEIAPAQATKDLKAYRDLAPNNAFYDKVRRAHVRADEFKPLFSFDTTRTLSTLTQGYGDGFSGKQPVPFACESRRNLNEPDLEIVACLSEAIERKQVVLLEYVSLSSGNSEREFVPHSLVDNGLRWHVRGFDRARGQFRDFVITRIKRITTVASEAQRSELLSEDRQWNRYVDLILVPHPAIAHKEAIELDYKMTDGSLKVEMRAATAGYLLRLWNVDCSESLALNDSGCLLALKNRDALYGVENLAIAPGYNSTKDEIC